jgi:hypothetical protein
MLCENDLNSRSETRTGTASGVSDAVIVTGAFSACLMQLATDAAKAQTTINDLR